MNRKPWMNRTLESVSGEIETDGIFTALDSLGVPWAGDINPELLNLEYYYNVSGEKIISPLVRKRVVDGIIPLFSVEELAQIALAINGGNWAREYATLTAQYDPISNYDMEEHLTNDITQDDFGHVNTRQDNLSHTKTGTENRQDNLTDGRTLNLTDERTADLTDERTADLTDARTANLSDARTLNLTDERTPDMEHSKTGTETKTPGVTITASDTVYGFNSSAGVPTNSREQVSSGEESTEYDLTETESGTDTTTHTGTDTTLHTGTDTTAHTGTDTTMHTGTDTTRRTGTDTETHTGTDTETHTGTDTTTHTGTSGITYNTTDANTGTQTDTESGRNTKTRNYTLTRRGNIGVTTSQQMLQSERELWTWNFFRDIVFPDLDRILTIPVY